MRTTINASAGQAQCFHPEVLRQARIRRRVLVSDSVVRLLAKMAYGEDREPQSWPWSTGPVQASLGCRS